MIKKVVYSIIFLITIHSLEAQVIKTELPDTISHWEKVNKVGLDFSQITFVNWSAGGNNSISGLAKGQFIRNYTYDNFKWANELLVRYGVNKQEGQDVRKTDDAILLNSTIGYRTDTISNWFHGGKLTFQTQFANGYNYPNIEKEISKPFSPAYLFLGIGSEYSRKDLGFNVYLSPLTMKMTMVLDRTLANEGAFGVEKATYDPITGELVSDGRRFRTELGALVTGQFKKEVFKNIIYDTRATLYTDYLKDFGNIDVDWQNYLEMTINKYVKASLGVHMIYDNDIKTKVEENGVQVTRGPKLQLKQIIAVGLSYSF